MVGNRSNELAPVDEDKAGGVFRAFYPIIFRITILKPDVEPEFGIASSIPEMDLNASHCLKAAVASAEMRTQPTSAPYPNPSGRPPRILPRGHKTSQSTDVSKASASAL
ncbi:hypothetical protein IGS68_04040 [Skermanella sp. TT6]|uniref:Uncharacterized protein n=1 Tax=Skermanella cutis TaxID=2775420 RepID=A0ABX7BH85_9PROT|nr:hypothetical protein [Skermanella sp. TT6]QQP92658.1 hypothetical protein IGS68_04040 [Skermanella sp. TT6]